MATRDDGGHRVAAAGWPTSAALDGGDARQSRQILACAKSGRTGELADFRFQDQAAAVRNCAFTAVAIDASDFPEKRRTRFRLRIQKPCLDP